MINPITQPQMDHPDYFRAQSQALELLDKYDVEEPIVPILEIAQREGYQVNFYKPEGKLAKVSGFLNPETNTIFINRQDSPHRQNFTIAHELGHATLQHPTDEYDVLMRFATPIDKQPIEQEANCFAANILVPQHMLKSTLQQYELSPTDTALLAKLFGVSADVIKYRLKYLS